jgi:DNA-binding transcriptional regulator GbsR (MarR family)
MAAHNTPPKLDPVEEEFVGLWRRMSSLWGVSPTMAEIHGLLFLTALSMDDLMAKLAISRGNVSMSLSKLVEWGLVRRVHQRGDRRDYYESLSEVWEMFTIVAAQRKRREIDPILTTLQECEGRLPDDDAGAEPRRRVRDLIAFLQVMDGLAQRFFASQRGLRAAFDLLERDDP